jgi:hypothetical protein
MKVKARKIFASFGINRKVRSVFSARPTVQHTAQLGALTHKQTGMQNRATPRRWSWALGIVAMVAVLTAAMGTTPATARRVIDDGGDGGGGNDGGGSENGGGRDECLSGIRSWFTATPTEVKSGEFVTLAWQVTQPSDCPAVTVSISNGIGPVDPQGSRVVQVTSPGSWYLEAQRGNKQWTQDTTAVRFISAVVTITSDSEVEAFVTAISKPYAHVLVQNHVTLDLSGREDLYIAPEVVKLRGVSDGMVQDERIHRN